MGLEGRHVGIVGLGLMGGSLAGRLTSWGRCASVAAWDRDPSALDLGESRGLFTYRAPSLERLTARSQVLVLAVPVELMVPVSLSAAPFGDGLEAVLDLSSVRGDLHRTLGRIWGKRHLGFHPMAGKETGGVENASPDLVEEATIALVPGSDADDKVVSLAEEMAEILGASTLYMDPDEHDETVAWISHLPMVLASALALGAGEAMERLPGIPEMAAGGFRDTSRVASGPSWLTASVLEHNEKLVPAIRRTVKILEAFIDASPEEALRGAARAARYREAVLAGPSKEEKR